MANVLAFGCVERAVAAGRIRVHGWVHDLTDATLGVWSDELEGFVSTVGGQPGMPAD